MAKGMFIGDITERMTNIELVVSWLSDLIRTFSIR